MIAMIYPIGSACSQNSPSPRGSPSSSPAPKYTCVMHPDVISDKPGKCPKCGMDLVSMSEPPKKQTNRADAHQMSGMEAQPGPHERVQPEHEHGPMMKSSVDLADPMSREGSGTSWLPDSSPMYGRMFRLEKTCSCSTAPRSPVTPTSAHVAAMIGSMRRIGFWPCIRISWEIVRYAARVW